MSLEEAARSLLNDHDSNVADLESIGRRVTRWPEMEALRAALAVADTPTPNPWKDEVIEKLVISHIYKAEHENDPAKALHDLLSWEVAIALDPQVSSDAQALIDRGRNEAQEDAEPVAWAISYDGKTPYSLYEYGDCALLDLEVKRIGGTACKMPLYLHPPRRESESEPVAWHICDNIGALVTADRKEASAARECGHTVRQLVFREPRRESAESAELSDDTLVSLWNAAKASTLVNTWHNDQHKIAELRAVLRAAGGEE
jgi:hypothetical protein